MKSILPHNLPHQPQALDDIISQHEQQAAPLKPGAKAKIVWHNSPQKEKTPYAIVYLHGFKATHEEGSPVHTTIARQFGCNLYLSRLYGHGQIKKRKLGDLTPKKLIRSATDACRIGQQIGERVILMGTSTGASLALYLAALPKFIPSIAGLILYSPLIHLYGIQSLLLENSVGRSLLKSFPGKDFPLHTAGSVSAPASNIWYHTYQLNGALALGKMIQKMMKPSLFKKVQCPVFIGYYFKDKHRHDRVVSTPSIKRMAHTLGTNAKDVIIGNFREAGTHVICSSLLSNAIHGVTVSTKQFITDKLGLHAV